MLEASNDRSRRLQGRGDRARIRVPSAFLAAFLSPWALVFNPVLADDSGQDESPIVGDPVDMGDLDLGELGDLDLHDELALLAAEDIVVSAVRHAQPIEESPAAITVITREQIRASGYSDLADILRLVPNADVYRVTEGYIALGLRSRTTHGGELILALIDGRDIAPAVTGTPVWIGMPVDIGSIERIEIIRGPASTLYGANALQGVVNIVTRRPGEKPLNVEGDAWVSAPLGHAADLRAHGSSRPFSWWVNAGWDLRPSRLGLDADPDVEIFRARAVAHYRPSRERDLTAELGVSRMRGRVHWLEVGGGGAAMLHPYLRTRLRAGRTDLQIVAEYLEFGLDIDFGLNMPLGEDADPVLLAVVPPLNVPMASLKAVGQHHVDLFEGNRLTAGISVQVVHHRAGSIVRCPEVDYDDFDPEACESLVENEVRAGVFVQDEWRITELLTFTGGLRLDYNTLTPDPALSPRAALVWRPGEDHALRAAYGRAFRKPTFLQARGHLLLENPGTGPSEIAERMVHIFSEGIGNPSIGNEKVDTFEIGWRGRFLDGRLGVTADIFYNRYLNCIWFHAHKMQLERGIGGVEVLPENASLRFENLDSDLSMWSWGGELAVTHQPTRRLELRGIYGLDYFQETRIDSTTGEPLSQRAPWEPLHRLAGVVRWRPIDSLTTGIDLVWVAPYEVEIQDPASALMPHHSIRIGGRPLVHLLIAHRIDVGGASLEIGATAHNPLDLDIYDMPAVDTPEGSFGGERLSRRLRIFARARY